ncbi:MAG: cytochrome c oxidase subunit II [Firmicutes bacterium]|nr:cytochrome c oxidase subunit II [Bacillota bacterium]
MKGKQQTRRLLTYAGLGAVATVMLSGCGAQYQVLDPAGPVGQQELNLIVASVVLMLIVIIPVIAILVYVVYRYRDKPGNTAPYDPHFSDSKVLEVIWWGIPILIVAILGTETVRTTFQLTKPPSNATPITVEVTSFDWKWLFQYPDGHVATVNYAYIPVGVPVNFVLTSDAPMNSFWVPRLGGQEYTMPGMAMTLWLQAAQPGVYYGHGANFTGRGFSHTTFYVTALSMDKYQQWIAHVQQSAPALTQTDYRQLSVPSVIGNETFSSYPTGSFENTVLRDGGQYMAESMQMMNKLHPGTGSGSMPSGMTMPTTTTTNKTGHKKHK